MSSNNHNDVDDAATATAAAAATHVVKDDVDPKSDLQRRRRTGLLVFSIIYTVLYVGAYFGWGVSDSQQRDCICANNDATVT
jgi:hypothetical protein